jgi:hypothetical protein
VISELQLRHKCDNITPTEVRIRIRDACDRSRRFYADLERDRKYWAEKYPEDRDAKAKPPASFTKEKGASRKFRTRGGRTARHRTNRRRLTAPRP